MIASKVIYQHHFVIVLQQTPPYFGNQEANQVNIRTVRTKTSEIILNPNLLIFGSFCKSLLTGYFITGYV